MSVRAASRAMRHARDRAPLLSGRRRLALVGLFAVVVAVLGTASAAGAAGVVTSTGALPDGATYVVEIPRQWNGTLVLYSHGFVGPGQPNPARDAGDGQTAAWLLGQGFALAGSSYDRTGWAVEDAMQDQLATLAVAENLAGRRPSRLIAWGHSMGGLITAGLVERYPGLFAGALPICGVVGGTSLMWDLGLDTTFALRTLLAPGSSLQLSGIRDAAANVALARRLLAAAQATPQGRARIALAAALGGVPGWFDPGGPEPAPSDYTAQEREQYRWLSGIDAAFYLGFRADLEARAGGAVSSNVGVDYGEVLRHSDQRAQVAALYRGADLDLGDDLARLASAPRVAADPAATAYARHNLVPGGDITVPVLTVHTVGDGLVVPEQESAYRDAAASSGRGTLLREVLIHRAGHCSISPAETMSAFSALLHRVDTGRWDGTLRPVALNLVALGAGAQANVVWTTRWVPAQPSFVGSGPPPLQRDLTRAAPASPARAV